MFAIFSQFFVVKVEKVPVINLAARNVKLPTLARLNIATRLKEHSRFKESEIHKHINSGEHFLHYKHALITSYFA